MNDTSDAQLTTGRTWELTHLARPVSLNAERAQHWTRRAASTNEWRTAFFWLAKEQKISKLDQVAIEVYVESSNRRLADVGAAWPSVKAAIDGLTDAGVIPDDGPAHVLAVTIHAPTHTGRDAVTLVVNSGKGCG